MDIDLPESSLKENGKHCNRKCQRAQGTAQGTAALNTSGRCYGVPFNERARALTSLMAGAKPMSSNGEEVANDVVDREEPLGVCQRFEAPPLALAPARRLMC